jgi:hypothetical protein
MRYIFSKDPSGNYCIKVELQHGAQRLFVCWLYPKDVREGEKRSEAVDRLLIQAGYSGRSDYWQFWTNNHERKRFE